MSSVVIVILVSIGICVICYRVNRKNNTNATKHLTETNTRNSELETSPPQMRDGESNPMLRNANRDSHMEHVVNQTDKLRNSAQLNRRLTGQDSEIKPKGDFKSQVSEISYNANR